MPKIRWYRITGKELVPLAIRVSMGKTLLYPDEYLPPEKRPFNDEKLFRTLVDAVVGPKATNGYESLLEFIDVIFLVECSRVCSHELVRHRIASYTQSSTRYIMHTAKKKGLDAKEVAQALLGEYWSEYLPVIEEGLKDPGIFDRELRYRLPLATLSHILVKMNLRSVLNFLVLRLHPKAHWEIRNVAFELAAKLEKEGIPILDMLKRRKPGLAAYYDSLRDRIHAHILVYG